VADVRLANKSSNFGYVEMRRNLFATLRADFSFHAAPESEPFSRSYPLVPVHGRHARGVPIGAPETAPLTTAMRIIIICGALRFITKRHAHLNHPSQPVASLASSQPNN
jgi:hypothetical protein